MSAGTGKLGIIVRVSAFLTPLIIKSLKTQSSDVKGNGECIRQRTKFNQTMYTFTDTTKYLNYIY